MTDFQLADPERPIIILGVPRSGTTLLRALLCSQPEVFIANPSAVLWHILDKDIVPERLLRLLRDEEEDTHRSLENMATFVHRSVFLFWTTTTEPDTLGKTQVRRWGFVFHELDDGSVRKLFGVYPHAKFVHIIRDGRDVAASWLANFSWLAAGMTDLRRNPVTLAQMWAHRVGVVDKYPTHVLRLEDLSAPATRSETVTSLLDYLEIAAAPPLQTFCADLPWIGAQRGVWQRWREDLQPHQLEAMLRHHSVLRTLIKYGYIEEDAPRAPSRGQPP